MKYLFLIAISFLFAIPTNSYADEIPGSDDPALRTAALAWLNANDPAEAFTALGALASEGNIAARVLVNAIDSRFGRLDFPKLSRVERRQLLPPDNAQTTAHFSAYAVDRSLLPSSIASRKMANADTPDKWISGAQILVNAHLIDQLKHELRFTLVNRPELDIEAVLFVEKYVGDDDYLWSSIWLYRALEQKQLEFLEAIDLDRALLRRGRWKQEPWSSDQYASLSQALADGRWAAVSALGRMKLFANETQPAFADIPSEAIEQWADLFSSVVLSKLGETVEINDADLEGLGQLIEIDAKRSAYLQPLLNSCVSHCPDNVTVCLASGALGGLDRLQLIYRELGPVISLDEYFASERAARELTTMYGLQSREVGTSGLKVAMPQCYQDAAAGMANLVDPPDQ